MSLTHETAGPKILEKIKIYTLSRAKLLMSVWDEIPCILKDIICSHLSIDYLLKSNILTAYLFDNRLLILTEDSTFRFSQTCAAISKRCGVIRFSSVGEKTEYPRMGILGVLKDFAAGTSIHGLMFIVDPKLSSLKRTTWSFVFIAALMYATHELNLSVICNDIFF